MSHILTRIKLCACAASTLLCISIFVSVLHAQKPQSFPTKHVPPIVSSGQARLVGHAAPDQIIKLALILPPRDPAGLKFFINNLYDRRSSGFHKYLSVEDFTSSYAPSETDYANVLAFALSNGLSVTHRHRNRMVLDVSGPVSAVEQAFNVSLGLYQHPTENRIFFAPDREPKATLPISIWHIEGLHNAELAHPISETGRPTLPPIDPTPLAQGSGPQGSFLGSDRRAAYYGGTALDGSGQAVALVEFGGYDSADVQKYFSNVGQTQNIPINNVFVDGADLSIVPVLGDLEQVIDIVEAASVAPNLAQILVYIGPYPANLNLYSSTLPGDILSQIATDNIAKQISISWTFDQSEPTKNDPLFVELAAQGQSVFTAAGDEGQYGSYLVANESADPSESEFVTSVGGTDLVTNGPGGSWQSESAWLLGGGGISPNDIPIPTYQQIPAVTGQQNTSSAYRNVPDVAAEANNDNYYCGVPAEFPGSSPPTSVCGNDLSGTSLAAPTWAAITALMNQQAVMDGFPVIGFANPMLYAIGSGPNPNSLFHDITQSSTPNTPALVGYDLLTGWGTPSFDDTIPVINVIPGTCALHGSFGGDNLAPTVVSMADLPYNWPIYYTTDGTIPNSGSNLYTGPISFVGPPITFNAVAISSSGATQMSSVTAYYPCRLG